MRAPVDAACRRGSRRAPGRRLVRTARRSTFPSSRTSSSACLDASTESTSHWRPSRHRDELERCVARLLHRRDPAGRLEDELRGRLGISYDGSGGASIRLGEAMPVVRADGHEDKWQMVLDTMWPALTGLGESGPSAAELEHAHPWPTPSSRTRAAPMRAHLPGNPSAVRTGAEKPHPSSSSSADASTSIPSGPSRSSAALSCSCQFPTLNSLSITAAGSTSSLAWAT